MEEHDFLREEGSEPPSFRDDSTAGAGFQRVRKERPGGGAESGSRRAGRASRGTGRRAQDRIQEGMREVADRLDLVAQQLEELADEHLTGAPGPLGRAGTAAHSASDTLGSVASYLRTNDVEGVRDDVERQVREHPLRSLLIAVATGWVVGKIVR